MTAVLLLLFLFINVIKVNAIDYITLKEMNELNKNVVYSNYVAINNGKIKNIPTAESVYFTRMSSYLVKTRITNVATKIKNSNRDFLAKWLEAKYEADMNISNSLTFNLIYSQDELFFGEITLYEDGKTYNSLIQRNVLDKIQQQKLLNKDLVFEIAYLGFTNGLATTRATNYFLVTNVFEKATDLNNSTVIIDSKYSDAKKAIENERYEYATQKLKEYITQNPNDLEAKKDLCLTQYLKYLKTPTRTSAESSIRCYESIKIIYDKAEIYYSIASIYNQEKSFDANLKRTEMLKNLNKAVDMLQEKPNLSAEEKVVLYNSLYLRGKLKLSFNDKSGLDDLSTVERERPDLVNMSFYTVE